jgi:thiol-disulfide isomerase/thioredoxin
VEKTIRVLASLLILATGAVSSPDRTDPPREAWRKIYRHVESVPPDKRAAERRERAAAYLERWEKTGRVAHAAGHQFLALLLSAAGREAEAQEERRACVADPGSSSELCGAAAAEFTRVLLRRVWDGALGDAELARAAKSLESVLGHLRGRGRDDEAVMILQAIAQVHERRRDDRRALQSWREASRGDVDLVVDGADCVRDGQLRESLRMRPAAEIRGRVRKELDRFVAIVDAWERGGEGRTSRARKLRNSIRAAGAVFDLLGKPAPDWVVRHAYGPRRGPRDYAGRVVLVDCWATWCAWCIRSFPSLRDLHASYASRGLAIVGATVPSRAVWSARPSCDPGVEGVDPEPLRLRPDASDAEIERFRREERDRIGEFARHHRLPWDIVLLADGEAERKLGLRSWPHLVLIDRRGRIRAVHAGALGVREADDALVRAAIEALLEEPAPTSAAAAR